MGSSWSQAWHRMMYIVCFKQIPCNFDSFSLLDMQNKFKF